MPAHQGKTKHGVFQIFFLGFHPNESQSQAQPFCKLRRINNWITLISKDRFSSASIFEQFWRVYISTCPLNTVPLARFIAPLVFMQEYVELIECVLAFGRLSDYQLVAFVLPHKRCLLLHILLPINHDQANSQ